MIVFTINKVVEDAEEDFVEEGFVGGEEEEAGADTEVVIMDITHITEINCLYKTEAIIL